ncbi:MAG TPA: polysaccharide deacetylase family protein [Smithella sp.]|nr:polysaccharide deacetylase family protein [Smithella sp.]
MLYNNNHIILTIDVEDNFTPEELAKPGDWEIYEGQVVQNTDHVIKILKDLNADATFFVLGKVAQRHPEIVSHIEKAGYEVASHGFAHERVDRMTGQAFEDDLKKSLDVLQSITGNKVKGFRARSFSITTRTLWALDILAKYHLNYDSSIMDTEVERIMEGEKIEPKKILRHSFVEFPISTTRILGFKQSISGGIAFRLIPFPIYRRMLKRSYSFMNNRVLYCHVWEFNKDQPKRKISLLQSIAQATWTYTTESKIRNLALHYKFVSIRKYLKLFHA